MKKHLSRKAKNLFNKPSKITSISGLSNDAFLLLGKDIISFDHSDLSFCLSGLFEESMWFVPDVMSYIMLQKEGNIELLSTLLTFLLAQKNNLEKIGLWNDVSDDICHIFYECISRFLPKDSSVCNFYDGCMDCIESYLRNEFLIILFGESRRFGIFDIYDRLLDEWPRGVWGLEQSCHFLDMCIQFRIGNPDLKILYKSKELALKAFDGYLIKNNWMISESHIKKLCCERYVSGAMKILGL